MNASSAKAAAQLQRISERIAPIEDRLHERLPHQQRVVAAAIAGAKWIASVFPAKDHAALLKKTQLQLQAYRYRVLEQAELLTRLLCDLDLVLSEGDDVIRAQRKATVLRIQALLKDADALHAACDKLAVFAQRLLSSVAPHNSTSPASPATSQHVQENAVDEEASDEDEDDNQSEDDDNQDADNEAMEDDESVEDDETMEDHDMDDTSKTPKMPDVATLPVYQPPYEVRQNHRGLYLVADLRGVDPASVSVSITPEGLLQVAGVKLPTAASPTAGRVLFREQFPARLVDVTNVSYQLSAAGGLQVLLPRRATYYPRRQVPAFRTPYVQAPFVW